MVKTGDAGLAPLGVRSLTGETKGSRAMAPPATTIVDPVTVDQLSEAFNRCFETLDAPPDLFTEDVFFDLYPPFWRFQLQGLEAITAQLRAVAGNHKVSSRLLRVVPTATGFVMEHEERSDGATSETARKVWLCEVRDDRIASATCYCNGGWDDELRARHAAEAPMLRLDWPEVTS
jgi:hypothetical protein